MAVTLQSSGWGAGGVELLSISLKKPQQLIACGSKNMAGNATNR